MRAPKPGADPAPSAVGIVTVNWNSREHTENFASLVSACGHASSRLVIVNNDPGDRERLDALVGETTTVLHSGGNVGYAAALNRGIRMHLEGPGPPDYLLLMNNDTEFEPDFLHRLGRLGRRDAIFSPVILYHGTDIVQNTGGRISVVLGGALNINKNAPYERLTRTAPDFLSGCCMYMHREVIEKTGLFDERYHSYYEDADFCLRALKKGIGLEILWDLKLWHRHSGSTRGMEAHKVRLLSRNTLLFAQLRMRPPRRWVFMAAGVLRGFLQNAGRGTFGGYAAGVREGMGALTDLGRRAQ